MRWVEFGKPKRMIPIHKIQTRIGEDLSLNVVKAHILTGCDQISKVGTKHAALVFNPVSALSMFGESPTISEFEMSASEEYLVKCWHGARSKTTAKTFDELRLHVKSTKIIGLDQFPPTSSVICGHLRRCYYAVRNAITLLGDNPLLDARDYGWEECDGVMVPAKCMNKLPEKMVKLCGCEGKCETNRCSCKKGEMK